MNTTKRLKMLMLSRGISQVKLSELIGISQPTLRDRFACNNWKWWEICELIKVLEIDQPQNIFFKNDNDYEGVVV